MDVNALIKELAENPQNENEIIRKLWDELGGKLRDAAFFILRDAHTAEDIVQDSFVVIWKKACKLKNYDNCLGWMLKIVKNMAFDWLRKHRKVDVVDFSDEEVVANIARQTGSLGISLERRVVLKEIFESFSPEDKKLIHMLVTGLRCKEIVHVTNMTFRQIRYRIKKIRCKIMEDL